MATKYNLNIIRGSRYLKSFIYKDVDKTPISLTGLSARMSIRARDNSTTSELELTTTNNRLVLEAAAVTGKIDIVLGATETDTLTIDTGVYDLELYSAGDTDIVDTVLEGLITIRDAITR